MNPPEIMKQIKKRELKDSLRSSLETSIDGRCERYLDIGHQWIIGNHYFSNASVQCVELYRDGYFMAAVMMSHAINEAIIRFIVERNHIGQVAEDGKTKSKEVLIKEIEDNKTVSQQCVNALRRIYQSHRNDVHHFNPPVASINFESLARENLLRLAVIEKEIFEADVIDGKMSLHNSQYWDMNKDGTVNAFIRLE